MRRLLLIAVVVELVGGGLALTAVADGRHEPALFGTTRTAPLSENRPTDPGRDPDSDSESAAARAVRFVADLFGTGRGESTPTADAPAPASASGPAGAGHDRSRGPGGPISFKEPIDFATGAVPSSAAFNAASGDQVAMLLAKSGDLSDSVAVGDFNLDGNPDVAQTNVVAGSVSILLGDGRGGFASPSVHPVGEHPNFVVAGHLDRDGHLDLAVANSGSNAVSILFGEDGGTFRPGAPVPVPAPRNVAIGDFNGDDNPDLAVASRRPTAPGPAPAGGVAIVTGNGDGGFVQAQFLTHSANGSPAGANSVVAGDFNGGGFDDIAVAVGTSKSAGDRQSEDTRLTGDDLLVFLNRNESLDATPAEPFGTAPDQPAIRVGAAPEAIAVSHLNGDAHLDLAVMANASGDMTTLLGDSHGRFEVAATNITASGVPRALAVGDFNDDGVRDIVTANFHGSTVSVLQGNGDGTLQPAVEFWSGDVTTGVGVGDFDGDGRVDIVAGRLRDDELALLLNDSPQPGDGVVITRDIPYGSPTHPTDDPYAAHHVLDVYSPPPGTTSLAGRGRRYPVAMFVHGGAGQGGDKAMGAYIMRRLAQEGIVVVAIDYRLKPAMPDDAGQEEQTKDVAHAFRWVRDHVGTSAYGGDPDRIFIFSHSHGSLLAAKFGTEPRKWADQEQIRGLVLVSYCPPAASSPAPTQRPSLLVTGTEGYDATCDPHAEAFSRTSEAVGAKSEHQTVAGRDHMTVLANIARAGDPARVSTLRFMRDT